MQKLWYNTQHTYRPRIRFEMVEGESQTVPGEARTIGEMLRRAQQGIREDERPVHYFDEEDLDKIDMFFGPSADLTDLDELRRRNEQMALAIDKAEKAKAEADAKAKAEAEAKRQAREKALDALTGQKDVEPKAE